MEATTAYLNRKYRPVTCCCFSLKVGAAIIGIYDILCNIFWMVMGHFNVIVINQDNNTENNTIIAIFSGDVPEVRIFTDICRAMWIAVTAIMVYGNFKEKIRLMLPYAYARFGIIIATIVVEFILTITLLFLSEFAEAFRNFILSIVVIVVGVYVWQIVQCRILEIRDAVPPVTFYTYGDPGVPPAYTQTAAYGGPSSMPPFGHYSVSSTPITISMQR